MLYKETQHSLMDFLLQIMPDLKNFPGIILVRPSAGENTKAAKVLMSIWKDEKNKIDTHSFKRPNTLTTSDINEMESGGFIKMNGDTISITPKGVDVIKTMILGDDKSSFESEEEMDYERALANTKPRKKVVTGKTASITGGNWYVRMRNGCPAD